MTRFYERSAARRGCPGIEPDGEGVWSDFESSAEKARTHLNKSALWRDEDFERPAVKTAIGQIDFVKQKMRDDGHAFCSAAGTFVKTTYTEANEKKKLWEDTWVLAHADVQKGMRVLDIGGASTPFSFCLADLGCDVTVVDNDWGNCGIVYNANQVARDRGWALKALDHDISGGLPFPADTFDRVFSICVIEHLTSETRRLLMAEIGRVLKPGGIAGLTTDYDPKRKVVITDKGLRFGFPEKFQRDVLRPSGLELMGNTELIDCRPEDDFLGAFFLRKKPDPSQT